MLRNHSSTSASVPRTALATTSLGTLRGVLKPLAREWLRVPFAEPPLGSHRWSPPVPKLPWQEGDGGCGEGGGSGRGGSGGGGRDGSGSGVRDGGRDDQEGPRGLQPLA